MTSKERASLKSQAVKIEPILQIGKAGITPELTEAVRETFRTRELTKIHILQSCTEDGRVLGQMLADRTASEVVQVIGRMIVLYKKNDEIHKDTAPKGSLSKSSNVHVENLQGKNSQRKSFRRDRFSKMQDPKAKKIQRKNHSQNASERKGKQ